ncbi:MAG: TetR/AcrR family transcriptional regulator [Hyphomicrobium sp.]
MGYESRDHILEAAFELFFAGTFHSVGMKAICDKAKVHKETVYHFFPTKNDLLLCALGNFTDRIVLQFEDLASSNLPPAEKLKKLYEQFRWNCEQYSLENGFAPGCFIGNISTELSSTEPSVRAKAQWAIDRISKVLQPTVEALLVEYGLGSADSWKATQVFMGLIQGSQVMAKLRNDVRVFDEFAPTVVDLVLSAGRADIAKQVIV